MEYACIYDPQLGDEDHVEQQIYFAYGDVESAKLVRLIGIAQGIAEISYSFDTNPVTHIRTGSHLILVHRLECGEDESNWRTGYWFTCALDAEIYEKVDCEALDIVISHGYSLWHLLNGSIKDADLSLLKSWWTEWCDNWSNSSIPILPPGFVAYAPGKLNQATEAIIEQGREMAGAFELLITLNTENRCYVSSGTRIDSQMLGDVQLWLTNGPKHTATVTVEDTNDQPNPPESVALIQIPPEPQDISIDSEEDMNSQAEETSHLHVKADSDDDNEEANSSGWSLSNYTNYTSYVPSLPSLPTLPQVSTISLPSVPHLSVPSVSSFVPSMSWIPGYREPPEHSETPEVGQSERGSHGAPNEREFINFGHDKLVIGDHLLVPTVYNCRQFSYIFLFDFSKCSSYDRQESVKRIVSELLEPQLEGFGYAAAPPTKFSYMVLDESYHRVVSTFPETSNPDIINCVRRMAADPQAAKDDVVQHTVDWWLSAAVMPDTPSIRILFGKQLTDLKGKPAKEILEQLHKATREWMDTYQRFL